MAPTPPTQKRYWSKLCCIQYGIAAQSTKIFTIAYAVNEMSEASNPTLGLTTFLVNIPFVQNMQGVTRPKTTGIHLGHFTYSTKAITLTSVAAGALSPPRAIMTVQTMILKSPM